MPYQSYLLSKKVKFFSERHGNIGWHWSPFCSLQSDTRLHCKTTDTRLVHHTVYLFTPQLSLALILLNPEGWPGWVNLDGWINITNKHYDNADATQTRKWSPIPILTPGRDVGQLCRSRAKCSNWYVKPPSYNVTVTDFQQLSTTCSTL